jgi:hypothetical protein
LESCESQHSLILLLWGKQIGMSYNPNYVAPGALAWQLLQVVGAKPGPAGGEKMSATTFIQRVNTIGGLIPYVPCSYVSQQAVLPYEADYCLYRADVR